MKTHRLETILEPDKTRVVFRPFDPTSRERVLKIVARVMSLSEQQIEEETTRLLTEFHDRHIALDTFLLKRFEKIRESMITDHFLSRERQLLIGAYFTHEYSFESAALFNPSIVPHPDQSGVPDGSLRFILTLRATGEGHVSSIVFRSGMIDDEARITLDPPTRFARAPELHPNPTYEKPLFEKKLAELGLATNFALKLLSPLGKSFTFQELESIVDTVLRGDRFLSQDHISNAKGILSVARANYEIYFDSEQKLSERIIFPCSPAERRGIEDARCVRFLEDDGSMTYYATYTAFDGQVMIPQILATKDFLRFEIGTLNGPEVQNKGMALFPRKIGGHYAMLSRQDNENIYLMYSDMLHFWYTKEILTRPTYPWEFMQIGNCGSPIETEAGWLVLTHGVGAMRKYSIGAILLDRDDPGRVIGRLPEPLLTPNENEREGYVPNVLYSCGSIVHAGKLILPYAMSDQCSTFAVIDLCELLDTLMSNSKTN